jgi:6-phosphofructokinase
MRKKKRIAILTGGGDCPGINAVIRAVTKKAIHEKEMEVIGIEDGYHGMIENRHRPLGGIGFVLGEQIEKRTGLETRTVVMGHLLRGGPPTPFDRIPATGLGSRAVDMAENKEFGYMVGVKGNSFITIPLEEVAKGPKTVPLNHPMIKSARSLGTCFGDE